MNLFMPSENLKAMISRKGLEAIDLRQVSKRLKTLLPHRFRVAKEKHRNNGLSAAKAMRLALTDPEYLSQLDEFISVSADARQARVLYEVHMMLLKTRQSLRGGK